MRTGHGQACGELQAQMLQSGNQASVVPTITKYSSQEKRIVFATSCASLFLRGRAQAVLAQFCEVILIFARHGGGSEGPSAESVGWVVASQCGCRCFAMWLYRRSLEYSVLRISSVFLEHKWQSEAEHSFSWRSSLRRPLSFCFPISLRRRGKEGAHNVSRCCSGCGRSCPCDRAIFP